jgi:hypothetical protein
MGMDIRESERELLAQAYQDGKILGWWRDRRSQGFCVHLRGDRISRIPMSRVAQVLDALPTPAPASRRKGSTDFGEGENVRGSMRPFAKGDRVVVVGPPGEVTGKVLEATTPEELPDLGPGSASKEAKDAMQEMHVDLMLLIRRQHEGRPVCFWAVHNPNGWVDLQGQPLTIRKTGGPCGAQA